MRKRKYGPIRNGDNGLLREVPQLGQLIQKLLQIAIGDFVLKTGDEGLGFLGIIAAQTPCLLVRLMGHMQANGEKRLG